MDLTLGLGLNTMARMLQAPSITAAMLTPLSTDGDANGGRANSVSSKTIKSASAFDMINLAESHCADLLPHARAKAIWSASMVSKLSCLSSAEPNGRATSPQGALR